MFTKIDIKMFSDIWGMYVLILFVARLVDATDVSKTNEVVEENKSFNDKVGCIENLDNIFNEIITEFNKINITLFQKHNKIRKNIKDLEKNKNVEIPIGELYGTMLRKQIDNIRQNMIDTQKEIRALTITNKNKQIYVLNTKMEHLRYKFTDINDQYEKYLKNKINFERRSIEFRMKKHTYLVKFKQEEKDLNEKLLILQEFKKTLQCISKTLLLKNNYQPKESTTVEKYLKELNQIKQILSKIGV